jgi:signal transduction histidine kinase
MGFKVAARTILQLGSELISSDSIALYELIKNSFDARTKTGVRIKVYVRMAPFACRALKLEINALIKVRASEKARFEAVDKFKQRALKALDPTAPNLPRLRRQIQEADGELELLEVIEEANFITISDTGEGMSLEELSSVYLTIGTRSRLKVRSTPVDDKPILGEKGLGRLAVMRLGMKLKVTTSRAGEKRQNLLVIDWKTFETEDDSLLSDVDVQPKLSSVKDDPESSGTTIHVSDLNADWSIARLKSIARDDFSRIMDPFSSVPLRVFFEFNDETVTIDRFKTLLFDNSDAELHATVKKLPGRGWELRGNIDYKFRQRKKSLHLSEDHLLAAAGLESRSELDELGAFSVLCYWFNRRRIAAIEGIGDKSAVRDLVDRWGGGLMVFRDGFRVHPYGGPNDDWLELDPIAFKSQGYKVNRKQIIGKVDITSFGNPNLKDQTNREGLRETPAKLAFVEILKHVLTDLRSFMTEVDDEFRKKELLDIDRLEERVEVAQERLEVALNSFQERFPREKPVIRTLKEIGDEINSVVSQARDLIGGVEARQNQLVHLAGIGLMVEIVAHELNRTALYTLTLLTEGDFDEVSDHVQTTMDLLAVQLKTIQKRLRILDPLSTAGRQVKERFDLVEWIQTILSGHEAEFEREGIELSITVTPKSTSEYRVRAVKGMIVQVLENLVANSVYWLRRTKKLNPRFSAKIEIVIDTAERQVRVIDNGPGVELDRESDIFLPFVTTKPAREGKGLGLYVSREIAKYHGGDLYLSPEPTVHPAALNTFVFELPSED